MNHSIVVENIKCGGCMNSIRKALLALPDVQDVHIDLETQHISITGDSPREPLVEALRQMGYPEAGHNSLGAKAKSFVSCAIGRMQKES